jgi:hypothetical protein
MLSCNRKRSHSVNLNAKNQVSQTLFVFQRHRPKNNLHRMGMDCKLHWLSCNKLIFDICNHCYWFDRRNHWWFVQQHTHGIRKAPSPLLWPKKCFVDKPSILRNLQFLLTSQMKKNETTSVSMIIFNCIPSKKYKKH